MSIRLWQLVIGVRFLFLTRGSPGTGAEKPCQKRRRQHAQAKIDRNGNEPVPMFFEHGRDATNDTTTAHRRIPVGSRTTIHSKSTDILFSFSSITCADMRRFSLQNVLTLREGHGTVLGKYLSLASKITDIELSFLSHN